MIAGETKMTTNFEQGLDVAGNVNLTGNITVGGNTITGDADTDNVTFNADISSHIIPDLDKTYSLGTITKRWDNIFGDSLNLESDLSAASAVITNSVTAEEFISTSTGTPTLSSGSDININPTGQVNVTSDMEVTGNLLVQGLLSNLTNWSIVENSGVLTFTNSSTSNNITMQNGVDGELALQSDVTSAVTGLASETYVQNYVAANAGGSGSEIIYSGNGSQTLNPGDTAVIKLLGDLSGNSVGTVLYRNGSVNDRLINNNYSPSAYATYTNNTGSAITGVGVILLNNAVNHFWFIDRA